MNDELKTVEADVKADVVKAKADESIFVGYVKTHYVVIGTVLGALVGFIAGKVHL